MTEPTARVGVLGTMVWDRIEHPNAAIVERWGGVSYSLAAAAAALPEGGTIRPIIKVGRDLEQKARGFLDTLPEMEDGAVLVVPEPNNRVYLRYHDRVNRHETLTGGVPAWNWGELEPAIDGLDALFVNLISGFELELDAALRLRADFVGPLYADLHSLLLGVNEDGARVPRPLQDREAWLGAFDVVQVNRDEMELVAGDDDPAEVARNTVRSRGGAVLVTEGPTGATWFARADAPRPWEDRQNTDPASVASGVVAVEEPALAGDPTGCGDVWGATCFMALLRGEALTDAMAVGNRAARQNVDHRGAEGLYHHLRKHT